MCLRSLHVTALSFALSHLIHAPCFLCPTAVAKRLTSSRWWIYSDTIFLLFAVILWTANAADEGQDLLFHLPPCQLFLSSRGPIQHSQQLFLPSISNRLSPKAGHSSTVGRENHAAFGRVALFLIYIPQQVTTLEVLVLLMKLYSATFVKELGTPNHFFL